MSDFLIWDTEDEPQFCRLTAPRKVPDEYELQLGIPRAAGFPPDAYMEMDPKWRKAVELPDNVANTLRLVVVSPRVRAVIEAREPRGIEYLRVGILNHKGRVAADDYVIVHQTGLQDCIDLEKSDVEWNQLDPDSISSADALVLDESRIEPGVLLFRAKHFPYLVFVHRSLADELMDSGATNLRFLEVEEYPE